MYLHTFPPLPDVLSIFWDTRILLKEPLWPSNSKSICARNHNKLPLHNWTIATITQILINSTIDSASNIHPPQPQLWKFFLLLLLLVGRSLLDETLLCRQHYKRRTQSFAHNTIYTGQEEKHDRSTRLTTSIDATNECPDGRQRTTTRRWMSSLTFTKQSNRIRWRRVFSEDTIHFNDCDDKSRVTLRQM